MITPEEKKRFCGTVFLTRYGKSTTFHSFILWSCDFFATFCDFLIKKVARPTLTINFHFY